MVILRFLVHQGLRRVAAIGLSETDSTQKHVTPTRANHAATVHLTIGERERRSHRGAAERDAGVRRTGRLAKVAGRAGGLRPRKAPLGARANRGWLLSCRLALTRRRTPTSRSAAPLPTETGRTTFPNGRRQREPAGRSPAQRAAKRERSDARGREDYGWGWAGGVAKPNHAPSPTRRPPNTRGSASRSTPPRPLNARVAFRRVPFLTA